MYLRRFISSGGSSNRCQTKPYLCCSAAAEYAFLELSRTAMGPPIVQVAKSFLVQSSSNAEHGRCATGKITPRMDRVLAFVHEVTTWAIERIVLPHELNCQNAPSATMRIFRIAAESSRHSLTKSFRVDREISTDLVVLVHSQQRLSPTRSIFPGTITWPEGTCLPRFPSLSVNPPRSNCSFDISIYILELLILESRGKSRNQHGTAGAGPRHASILASAHVPSSDARRCAPDYRQHQWLLRNA